MLLADRFVVGCDGFSCVPFSRDGGEGSGANLLPVVPSGDTPGAVIDVALTSSRGQVPLQSSRTAGCNSEVVEG